MDACLLLRNAIKAYLLKTDKTALLFYKSGKMKRLAAKFKLNGTVTSGDATATTLGNTLRVLMFVKFAAHLANIK